MSIATLKITSGSDEIDFLASGFSITDWSPAVANRRQNMLGGRGPYEDVIEEIEIDMAGSSIDTNLDTLQLIFDRVQRWERGENVDATILKVQFTGGSTWQSTIIGADGAAAMITLPPSTLLYQASENLSPVLLRFKRIGWWLGDSVAATSSTGDNPTTLTASLSDSGDAASPFKLEIDSISADFEVYTDSFLVYATGTTTTIASERLIVYDAEDMGATGSEWSTPVDSANEARGGNVLRFTPDSTDVDNKEDNGFTADATPRRWAMFINYSNNGAHAYTIRGYVFNNQSGEESFTPPLTIAAATNDPKWVGLGTVPLTSPLINIGLEVQAAATGGSIDFDTIVLVAVDSPGMGGVVNILTDNRAAKPSASSDDITVDHRLLTDTNPSVYQGTVNTTLNYRGSLVLYADAGADVIAACWLATKSGTAGVDPDWRAGNTSGVVQAPSFTVTLLEATTMLDSG